MNTIDDLELDESRMCNVFFGPGWWPVVSPEMCENLIARVDKWCDKYDLSNIDFLITVSQIVTPPG